MNNQAFLLGALLASALLLSGCYHGPSAGGEEVTMEGFTFQPDELEVPAGTTVTWTNEASVEHTTTSDDGIWDSGLLGEGETFSHTFEEAGEYPYHCIPHEDQGMTGTIIVT